MKKPETETPDPVWDKRLATWESLAKTFQAIVDGDKLKAQEHLQDAQDKWEDKENAEA